MPQPRSLAEIAQHLGLNDPRIAEAMRVVSRLQFVPPEHANLAALDVPIPIGHEQVTTQPSLVAVMVEALGLTGDEEVLEIGTGLGYQTALLARLAKFVWSVERWPDLASAAGDNLAAAGISNVEIVIGDGSKGLPEHAPYDAIVVSAAFPRVPSPLVVQLREGGHLVQPVGPGGNEEVVRFVKKGANLQREKLITLAHFVPLVGAYGFAPE